jgi:hypothetical protein
MSFFSVARGKPLDAAANERDYATAQCRHALAAYGTAPVGVHHESIIDQKLCVR